MKNSKKKTSSGTKHPEKIFVGGSTKRNVSSPPLEIFICSSRARLLKALVLLLYTYIVLLTLKKGEVEQAQV